MISLTDYSGKAAVLLFTGLLAACASTDGTALNRLLPEGEENTIAVFPIENLSAASAPLDEVQLRLIKIVRTHGSAVLEPTVLEEFMARNRVRHTGGLSEDVAEAIRREAGVGAVLISTLEHYDDKTPPKIALTARLVTTEKTPTILWMDSIGLSGDQSPGFLGLGRIGDPQSLMTKALESLSDSLTSALSQETRALPQRSKFRPKVSYRSRVLTPTARYRVAVMPFLNKSDRKHAGDILVLHFIRELSRMNGFDVVDPGVIRQQLLRFRIIMEDGISLSDADLIFSELNVDLIVTGKVLDYRDPQGATGTPMVDFSAMVVERKSREIVWASKSHNKGSDGVFFFDAGRMATANSMASEMVRHVAARVLP